MIHFLQKETIIRLVDMLYDLSNEQSAWNTMPSTNK